jgi:pimeloyl-ACP methyl ester carboxylesterase
MTTTLDTGDATIYYERRGDGPLLVLVGAPMDADAFAGAAELLAAGHTVLTTDPRGINRSSVADPDADSFPEQRAADLARLIEHAGAGPATVFGSSGGAVSVLALVQSRPDLVRTAIAHEPPLEELLPDREQLRADTEEMIRRHLAGDRRGAWQLFLSSANIQLPAEAVEAMFAADLTGRPAADEHFQFAHMLRGTARWLPDLDILRATPVRLLVGLGEDSAGEVCDRTSRALAAALGTEPTMFPGGHIGFAEDPKTFADRLGELLRD